MPRESAASRDTSCFAVRSSLDVRSIQVMCDEDPPSTAATAAANAVPPIATVNIQSTTPLHAVGVDQNPAAAAAAAAVAVCSAVASRGQDLAAGEQNEAIDGADLNRAATISTEPTGAARTATATGQKLDFQVAIGRSANTSIQRSVKVIGIAAIAAESASASAARGQAIVNRRPHSTKPRTVTWSARRGLTVGLQLYAARASAGTRRKECGTDVDYAGNRYVRVG